MSARDILDLDELATVKQRLAKLLRPSIELTSTPIEDAKLRRGASKLGGAPDLPKGTPWPTAKLPLPRKHGPITGGVAKTVTLPDDGTISLGFVAQIALADVAKLDRAKQLPKAGLLSFFYDQTGWGERKGDRTTYLAWGHPSRVRVIHTPTTKGLERLTVPDSIPDPLPPARLSKPTAEDNLPNFESAWFFDPRSPHRDPKRQLALTDSQRGIYVEEIYNERANSRTHMLLGHADYVQPYGLENGYLAAHAYLFPDEPKLVTKGAAPIRAFQASQLLLQISADGYGRGGRLFFFIRNADLAAGKFSRVWVTEQ